MPMDPPPIKIGPGRPRKSRFKSPHEDPKHPDRLTKHGVQMTCTLCKSTMHNKRKCPEKGKVHDQPPQPKKPRGRPKKTASTPLKTPTEQPSHHLVSAQPSTIGRVGRTIRAGQGVRSAIRGAAIRRSERHASSSATTSQVAHEYLQY